MGAALFVYGVSGFHAVAGTSPSLTEGANWDGNAGWPMPERIQMTCGVVLLGIGALICRSSSS